MIDTYHLAKVYTRGVYALRDVSVHVDKGEFVFLTGPSGAGKSTLLRLLLRQDVPTDGQLLVNGKSLAAMTPGRGAGLSPHRSGFVFQDFKLVHRRTVFENVTMVLRALGAAPSVQRRRALQVLQGVVAAASARRLPARVVGRRAAARRDRARAGERARRSCSPTSPPATSTRISRAR